MTGTSMDGIDISLVRTNGINLERLNQNYFYEYDIKTKKFLFSILKRNVRFIIQNKKKLDEIVTEEHFKALKDLDIVNKSDLIGFHGQTIYHNPNTKISIQLGDPYKLAKMLNKNVVFGFRTKDIELGGQGAPLAPIYHQFIISNLNLDLPSCILNIGGVANLTFWNGKKLIGFDTGPGNALMDDYMQLFSNKYFDKDGILASKGLPNNKIVNEFINNDYFKKTPPKSLDRNSFINLFKKLLSKKLLPQDIMATLAKFTIESIIIAIKSLPEKPKNILVTGGGYRNKYLMNNLKERLYSNIIDESDIDINFDYVESELIAFLSARTLYNLPFTFPSTTGILKPSSGGKIYSYL